MLILSSISFVTWGKELNFSGLWIPPGGLDYIISELLFSCGSQIDCPYTEQSENYSKTGESISFFFLWEEFRLS